MTGLDIDWILEAPIYISKVGGSYLVYERGVEGRPARQCTISWNHQTGTGWARMLFNGEDIETESYMAFVGLLDQVDEYGKPGELMAFAAGE